MELSFVNGIVQGVFGPLASGMPAVMFEGTLDTPTWARAWEIVERYRVNTLFTTPSVVRHLRRWSEGPLDHDVSTLRVVITGGERFDEADATWLRNLVPPDRLLVVNAWGQTETAGAVLFSPPPYGPATLPTRAWPSSTGRGAPSPPAPPARWSFRTPGRGSSWNVEGHTDVDGRYWRYRSEDSFCYATGDLASQPPGGELEIIRRLDSVVKVSGQLVSLSDIGEALGEHPLVEEALAVQTLDAEGGRVLLGCVVLTADSESGPEVAEDLCRHVYECLGGLARPAVVAFVESFPADATPAELRQALALNGAGRSRTESFVVSAAQLKEALEATRSA